ncbi:hypothetical protein LTR62_006132 [Meristemomyces frigidus]|uniref:Peptide hydrolase n=1 Tax=Meristemomyces frigidus TaxID=1508187 RepID=A0AAN7TCG9_9PEZI|nr:hypothetical protein LTR62_006132 [Meristemomyces frigidus]
MKLAALLLLPGLLRSTIAYTTLSDSSLHLLSTPGSDFDINNGKLLAPILRPRVPGTPGSEAVLFHFVDFFAAHLPAWKLTFQNSTSTTPTSGGAQVPFRNLIATRDPPWSSGGGDVGRLALVAHYDSKIEPAGFIGATDSAAPCAMLLHVARSIDAALTAKWAAMETSSQQAAEKWTEDLEDNNQGVQILLLDGEEAFKVWTHTDSLYGARALAEEWDNTYHPALSTYRTSLASIDLFLLLDLLGAAEPSVPSYFKTTHWAYRLMSSVESRLRKAHGIMKTTPRHPFLTEGDKNEMSRWVGGYIEDDHVPFMARGVDVLHLITSPFPHVWHTMMDDGEHLDLNTVSDWAMIVLGFVAEWMDLEGFLGADGEVAGRARKGVRDEL